MKDWHLRRRLKPIAWVGVPLATLSILSLVEPGDRGSRSAAIAKSVSGLYPAVPANGELGFVVERFGPARPPYDPATCPNGRRQTIREEYLESLPAGERERLLLPENEPELTRNWQALIFGRGGSNICSNPDMFERTTDKVVHGGHALGFDLDQGGRHGDSCAHEEFTSPTGDSGIDNQEYRVQGCNGPAPSENEASQAANVGAGQFHASGEWTQVFLIRGIDSFVHDDDVEVIYANTADRPLLGKDGDFLPGASFVISDKGARRRNVLRGRIDNGILTTSPQDIELAPTWGQSAGRDLRGVRSVFDIRKARVRLKFHADGSLTGMLGGYRPVFSLIISPSLGGGGAALSGIDCATSLTMLNRFADGMRDPKTGKCTAVSSAQNIRAIHAFVTDIPAT